MSEAARGDQREAEGGWSERTEKRSEVKTERRKFVRAAARQRNDEEKTKRNEASLRRAGRNLK